MRSISVVLRIERIADGEGVVLVLSGRLANEYLGELEALFQRRSERITLDLTDVTLVDREVVESLARWEAEGITLENCPAYVRDWIKKILTQK
jgi:hypothetical protein